jgi:hypothetical protein
MRITWRKQCNERGLAKVCQTPRGKVCTIDGEEVCRVYGTRGGEWYWVAVADDHPIPLKNTCGNQVSSLEEAQKQADKYIRQCLKIK